MKKLFTLIFFLLFSLNAFSSNKGELLIRLVVLPSPNSKDCNSQYCDIDYKTLEKNKEINKNYFIKKINNQVIVWF